MPRLVRLCQQKYPSLLVCVAALVLCIAGCKEPPTVTVEAHQLELSCPDGMALIQATSYKSGPFHAPRTVDAANDALPPPSTSPLATEIPVPAYCIDRYASAVTTDKPVAYAEAEQICRAQGKQLCSPYQWELACRGADLPRFSYGSRYDPACQAPGAAQCQSSYGVYDQLGRRPEWVLGGVGQAFSTPQPPPVMGGVLPGEDPADVDCLALRTAPPVAPAAAGAATAPADGTTTSSAPTALVARVRCCSDPANRSVYVLDYDR